MRWVALTAVALAVGPTGVAAFATPCAPSAPRGSSAWCPSGVRPGLRAVPIACAAAIRDLSARQILDSRGNPTVEVDLSTETGTFRASVPSGASTGEYEALELRDGDKSRWRGKGVEGPIDNIHTKILNAILGMDPTDQEAVDQRLLDADGTPDKSSLGANALLAVSLAVCKAGAASLNRPLYRHIADLVRGSGLEQAGWEARGRGKLQMPVPWLNVINGGAHAGNSLAVQEIMIGAVGASSFAEAMRAGTEVYHTLRDIIIERYGATATSVGDEGGFAPDISDIEEALGLITEAFKASGHADVMKIGLDVAASEMAVKEGTGFTYKMYPDRPPLSSDEMVKLYQDLCKGFPIVSIEDPLDQDDWEGFARMTSAMGAEVQVCSQAFIFIFPASTYSIFLEISSFIYKTNQALGTGGRR